MKKQRGFIQISILIVIIASVLVLSGCGYFGVRQYQNYRTEKIEKEKLVAEEIQKKNNEKQAQIEAQNKVLEKVKAEIEKLSNQAQESQKKDRDLILAQQEALERTSKEIEELRKKQDQESFTKQEISDRLSRKQIDEISQITVQVLCNIVIDNEVYTSQGSGRFVYPATGKSFASQGVIITNAHVTGTNKDTECEIKFSGTKPVYYFARLEEAVLNTEYDYAFLIITKPSPRGEIISLENLMKQISSPFKNGLSVCGEYSLGTQVFVFGYPFQNQNQLTVTDGIISSFSPENNFYTSAKIDKGNSGGIAVSLDSSSEVCELGIPTWANPGTLESFGVIQNVHWGFSSK